MNSKPNEPWFTIRAYYKICFQWDAFLGNERPSTNVVSPPWILFRCWMSPLTHGQLLSLAWSFQQPLQRKKNLFLGLMFVEVHKFHLLYWWQHWRLLRNECRFYNWEDLISTGVSCNRLQRCPERINDIIPCSWLVGTISWAHSVSWYAKSLVNVRNVGCPSSEVVTLHA